MDKQTNQCASLMADWKADTLFYLLQDENAAPHFPKKARDLPLLMENGPRGIILALFTSPEYARQMALHLPLQISSACFSDLQGLLAGYPCEIDGVVLNLRQDPQFISTSDFLSVKPDQKASFIKTETAEKTANRKTDSEPQPLKSPKASESAPSASSAGEAEKTPALPEPPEQMALETRPKDPGLLPALDHKKEVTLWKEPEEHKTETDPVSQTDDLPADSSEAKAGRPDLSTPENRQKEQTALQTEAAETPQTLPESEADQPEKAESSVREESLLPAQSEDHLPAIVPVYDMVPVKKSLKESASDENQRAAAVRQDASFHSEKPQAFVSEEDQAAMSFKTGAESARTQTDSVQSAPAQPKTGNPAGLPLHLPGGSLRPQSISALKRAARQIASVQKVWIAALNLERKPTWVLIVQSDDPIEKTASDSLMHAFIKKQMPGQSVMIFPSDHAYVQSYISKTKPVYTRRVPR